MQRRVKQWMLLSVRYVASYLYQFHVAGGSDSQGNADFGCQQMGGVGCSALAMVG